MKFLFKIRAPAEAEKYRLEKIAEAEKSRTVLEAEAEVEESLVQLKELCISTFVVKILVNENCTSKICVLI